MVEHDRRPIDAQFVAPAEFGLGSEVTLGPEAAHHMNVLRLDFGARIGVVDGAGRVGGGTLVRLGRRDAVVAVDQMWTVDRPPAVHMIVPVADRDRMLWMAEKCTELGVTSWRPVEWRRSASVSPRGVGAPFRDKVRARMIAALTQSRGAWLPEQFAETSLAESLSKVPAGVRLVLDPSGAPLLQVLPSPLVAPVTIAVAGGWRRGRGTRRAGQCGVRARVAGSGYPPVRDCWRGGSGRGPRGVRGGGSRFEQRRRGGVRWR